MKQQSPEWLVARRDLVTASDIPILLGLSPYTCEADLADAKRDGTERPQTLRMRVGLALEDVIGEAYTEQTGRKVRKYGTLAIHPKLPWAASSPDFRVIGERRLMEAKHTNSRSRFADGLPQDVEAQAVWQLGTTGYPRADVAALSGDELQVFPVEFDAALFDDLVVVASDFRRRLAEGGPFARDAARVKRDFPADDGSELIADAELTEAVLRLLALRGERHHLEEAEGLIETAVKERMGPASRLTGDTFHITWKRTRDREETDWKSLADGLLRQLPADQQETLVGLYTTAREGFRPFRVVVRED